jgi:hypothetical protein
MFPSGWAGGNKGSVPVGLGYGQLPVNVAYARSNGITYYNYTVKPITIFLSVIVTTSAQSYLTLNSILTAYFSNPTSTSLGIYSTTLIVPPGSYYSYNVFTGTAAVYEWVELN